jgi:hypothetical protein
MTGPHDIDDAPPLRRAAVRRALLVSALAAVALAIGAWLLLPRDEPIAGPTVGEKMVGLVADRAGLQARADGAARLALLPALRTASLLTDALVARSDPDDERPFERLPAFRRQQIAELEALNAALAEAMARPGDGARLAANKAAERANAELDRLAGLDDAPLVISFTPRFVPPRRAAGELTLSPGASAGPPRDEALRLGSPATPAAPATRRAPTEPRYAPDFAAARDEDPPVAIEITGLRLASATSPVLSVGAWRGTASVSPGRLRFAVPRAAFATDATRTLFAAATLSVRGAGRTASFQLLFTVLPDRPGAFALDQRVQTSALESKTLVSPEILARAPAGETRTVRRCFDPPPGWRFDQERRRVVVVERLGWQEDVGDSSLNAGSVEFAPEDKPGQICVAVSARPVSPQARTATIGRFEATLLRDEAVEQAVKSGIRALDWREPARVPIERGMLEWKLYVRLFDEIDREFDSTPASMAFLSVTRDGDRAIVLQADPTAEP